MQVIDLNIFSYRGSVLKGDAVFAANIWMPFAIIIIIYWCAESTSKRPITDIAQDKERKNKIINIE